MDGMIYVCVGKNLANGLGTFWHPHFSKTFMSVYHEQPPLLYGIEALFFKLLGNSMYVERIYNLLIAVLHILLIVKLWKLISANDSIYKATSWLPVLFWITIPVCFWAFTNSVEEITMGLFDLVSVLFVLKTLKESKHIYLNLFIAGSALIMASLCKGMQGLFPLAAVFIYWLVFRTISFKKMFLYSGFIILVVAVFYALILLNDTVYESYVMYFNNRLVGTFAHFDSHSGSRFQLLIELVSQLIPAIAIIVISLLCFKRFKLNYKTDVNNRKQIIFFLLVGLSGTLPLLITYEQRGFYLVTTLPYYAIALAMILANGYAEVYAKIQLAKKISAFAIAMVIVLICTFVFTCWDLQNGPKRDKEMLNDIYQTGPIIKEGAIIGIAPEMRTTWSLHAYYSRYFYISLDDVPANSHEYYLVEKGMNQDSILKQYDKIELATLKYDLYKRKK